jgi:CRP-like cAMP-binding protein
VRPQQLLWASTMLVQNRLLAGMAPKTFDHLRPLLQPIVLRRRAILQEYNCRIEHIYFIEQGLASVFARTQRDGPMEAYIVGRFGLVGVSAVLGTMRSPSRCLMEVPGEALRIIAKDLRRVIDDIPAVRQHLLDYVHALLIQNMQLALCNVRHELEERLCRWLLLASDRLDGNAIPLTHDQLSIILGVRRASISKTLTNLENAGAVSKSRRTIEIANRAILEKKTCECYRIIASEYARIIGSGIHII